jgi:hypothetical protein
VELEGVARREKSFAVFRLEVVKHGLWLLCFCWGRRWWHTSKDSFPLLRGQVVVSTATRSTSTACSTTTSTTSASTYKPMLCERRPCGREAVEWVEPRWDHWRRVHLDRPQAFLAPHKPTKHTVVAVFVHQRESAADTSSLVSWPKHVPARQHRV